MIIPLSVNDHIVYIYIHNLSAIYTEYFLLFQSNANGIRLKNMIADHGITKMAVDYILLNSPKVKTLLP